MEASLKNQTYLTNVPRQSAPQSFSRGYSQGKFFVDVHADIKEQTYFVTGRLYDRSQLEVHIEGTVKVTSQRLWTQVTLSNTGEFSLRLKQGDRYQLCFKANQQLCTINLDLR